MVFEQSCRHCYQVITSFELGYDTHPATRCPFCKRADWHLRSGNKVLLTRIAVGCFVNQFATEEFSFKSPEGTTGGLQISIPPGRMTSDIIENDVFRDIGVAMVEYLKEQGAFGK